VVRIKAAGRDSLALKSGKRKKGGKGRKRRENFISQS
jgi:hypothetical protein